MGWLNLIVGFVRLGPWVLFAVAGAVLGLGVYLQAEQNKNEAEKAAALAAGPPAAVDIAKFNRETDVTERDEVVVRAQANMVDAYELTLTGDGADDYAYMVPLLPIEASNDNVIFGVALFSSNSFTFDDLTPELTMAGVVGFGDYGPIIEYNGELQGLGKWDELTDEVMAIEGMTMAANSVVVWPYLEGRETALAPSELTMFGILSKVAAAIAALGLVKLVVRPNSGGTSARPEADPLAEWSAKTAEASAAASDMHEPEPETPGVAARSPDGVPLWKQRAGLADTGSSAVAYKASQDGPPQAPQPAAPAMDPTRFEQPTFDEPVFDEPVFEEPRFETTPEPAPRRVQYEDPVLPKGRSWGLRHVAIGIVGAAFVALLVSTVVGLMPETIENDQAVSIPTAQERLAGTVADMVVPDADPNRHWTDIDVTPIVEWVVAQGVLAATGDGNAIMNLGAIIIVPIFLMFMLRFYFMTRSALRPRTTARFDSMGIN